MRIALVVTLALAAGCSKPAPQQPAPVVADPGPASTTPEPEPATGGSISDADLDTLMHASVAFFGVVADAIQAAGTDCVAMAAGMERVTDDHADLLAAAAALDDDASAQQRADAWLSAHEEEIKAVFIRLFGAMQPCEKDPAVQAAMAAMSGGM